MAPEAEAEAAAEGIDGAENNNTDKRPGAARFHLFVYRISRMVLNKVPLEICGVGWDVTAPPPGCRVFPCCWRWRNWDRISPPHDLNVSAARVRLIPQSFGKCSVCRSQLSSSQDSESRDGNHLLPQPTGIFFFSFFFWSEREKKNLNSASVERALPFRQLVQRQETERNGT